MIFAKWHGIGNDFVFVDGSKEQFHDLNRAAVKICDRRFGIGADGLVLVLPSDKADFRMRIINSDGSEADMCGNATRCFARLVYETGMTAKTKIDVETLAGIVKPELIFENGEIVRVRVDMGEPRFKRGQIPIAGPADAEGIDVEIAVAGRTFAGNCLSTGNPHCVIFVDDISAVDLPVIGPKLENHSLFPKKANIEFAQILNNREIRMRVWERGAGITMACGTGATATLVAAARTGRTGRAATVHLDGGDLFVEWGKDNHAYMSGPATEVFRGEYLGQI